MRTPDQKAADEAVTVALEEWLRAYKFDGTADNDGTPRVLTDYIVFMATQGWTSDGDGITGYPYMLRDQNVPHYRALGLAMVGMQALESSLDDSDDEESQGK